MSDLAAARSRLYAVLGHLVLHGLDADGLAAARAIPVLADALTEPFDADAWAAEHHRVFAHELLPWESAFRSPDGQLGGPIASQNRAFYARFTFVPPADEEPDHLGVQLRFLASLRDDEAIRAFLGAHLLRWLPALAAADVGGLYGTVVSLANELALGEGVTPEPQAIPAPTVLDDPSTGLKRIAGWLATPQKAGLLWTRAAIAEAARVAEVPCGFGSRRNTLESALFAAADGGRIAALVDALETEVLRQERALVAMNSEATAPWLARLGGTTAILERLRTPVP